MAIERPLILARIDLIERSLKVAAEHAQILRWSVESDDVEGIMRGREGLHNALELIGDEMGPLSHDLPDWRPLGDHSGQADGYRASASPDAHLGATSA